MSSVRKRGKRWTANAYIGNGQYEWCGTFDTRAEAREAEREALSDRRRRSKMTVADFARDWPESHPSENRAKDSTLDAYRRVSDAFAAEYGSWRLDRITPTEARTYANAHRSHLGGLRAMFGDALDDELVRSNPFAKLRLGQGKGRKDLIVPSREQLEEIADTALRMHGDYGPMFRAVILFAAYEGTRPGEQFALRWSDIDFSRGEVRVERQFHKGRTTLPKNGKPRLIALTEPAADALRSVPRRVGVEWVFLTKRGRRLTQPALSLLWDPVRKAAGYPDLAFYSLRHAAATYLVEAGLDAWVVAQQLGHQDGGRLVQSLYAHPSDELARERIRQALGRNVAELRPVERKAADG
jgi:integrase